MNKILFLLISLLCLSACNPSQTTLGDEFLAGVTISLSHSTLTVSNSQVATSNSIEVTLRLKDQNGVPHISKRPVITFSKSGGTSMGTLSAVSNLGNGTYTATFRGVIPGTPTTLHAQVDGEEITSTLPTVKVTTGNFSLSNSTIIVSNATVTSGETLTVTLISRDISNTQLPDGGLTVAFSHSGGMSTGTFGSVTDNLDGTYSATLTGITSGTATNITATIGGGTVHTASPTVTVIFGAATKLAFVQEPTAVASGSSISPSVTVRALDINNNFVSTYATDIVMAIDTNPSTGTLAGTLTKTPSSGVATFNDLSINYYGTAYKLSATSGSLLAATSAAFNVTATAVAYELPFTAGTTSDYTASSWTSIEFVNDPDPDPARDYVRLIPTVQTDSVAVTGTMSTGTASGVVIGTLTDGVNTGLKLGNGGGCDGGSLDCAKSTALEIYELSSSWTPQWASVVSYWKMNESSWVGTANEVVDAKGTNHGVRVGDAITSSTAKLGTKSGIFDGTGDYLNAGTMGTWGASRATGYSIALWIKTGQTSTAAILGMGQSASGQNGITIRINLKADNATTQTGAIRIGMGSNEASPKYLTGAVESNTGITDGNWHHITVLVTPASNTISIYVDGISKTVVYGFQQTPTIFGNLTLPLFLSAYNNLGVAQQEFNGQLDEVAIWSTVLSTAEVQTIYDRQKSVYSGTFTSRIMDAKSSSTWTTLSWIPTLPFLKELPDSTCTPVPPATTCAHNNTELNSTSGYTSLVGSSGTSATNDLMVGLVGLWHLNESTVSTAANFYRDDSGNGSHGTLNDSTGVTVVDSKFGKGVSFGAANKSIKVPAASAPDPNDEITVSFWIKSFGAKLAYIPLLTKLNGVSGWQIDFDNFTDPTVGKIRVRIDTSVGVNQVKMMNNVYLGDQNWHHITLTLDSGAGVFYVNGTLERSFTYNHGTGFSSPTTDLTIAGGNFVNATADEIAIWSRPLHANEIKQLYQRGASRLKYQVRSCDDNACAGESWQGSDGTSSSYFSELNNNTIPLAMTGEVKGTLPSLLFSAFTSAPSNNQYFQYRTILESDSTTEALRPELKSTTVDPLHYPKFLSTDTAPGNTIIGNNSVAFSELNVFTQALGAGGCSNGVVYNLGLSNTGPWKYWTGTAWATANGSSAHANTAAALVASSNAALTAFKTDVGKGSVFIKAFLTSDGTTKCELDNIHVGGNR